MSANIITKCSTVTLYRLHLALHPHRRRSLVCGPNTVSHLMVVTTPHSMRNNSMCATAGCWAAQDVSGT